MTANTDAAPAKAGVQRWLARRPRFHLHFLHFTPTSTSWLNLVERLFAELTNKRPRRGIFRSVVDLQAAIHRYLRERNCVPRPFAGTKSADTIIRKYARAKGNLSLQAGHQVRRCFAASTAGSS